MRDAIINRINFMIFGDQGFHEDVFLAGGIKTIIFNTNNMKKRKKEQTIKENIDCGMYPHNFDFNSLSDEKLVHAFEHISRCYYKQWA